MNNFFRAAVLLLVVCLFTITAKAQVGFNYSPYEVGFGASINKVYGDAETFTSTPSIHGNFTYNVSPYLNYVFELQAGQLKGGDSLTTNSGRQFTNTFTSFQIRGQVQLGEIIDYSQSSFKNALKNLYLSTGIGFVVNHLTEANRYSILIPGYYTPGLNYSNEVLIPARIGYEFKIFNSYDEPSAKIDLGYQYNFVLGDNLDGYAVGNKRDAYSQITIGFKFAIGDTRTSYSKRIPY